MTIKILRDITINKIAAGEVVDRPLSVVKELVENSIDAGATEITVRLDRGGRTLISVQDNGDGIARDELGLALTRHATSKLDDDDLDNILHMGFRGEALASIATAARVSITSRHRDSDEAWRIKLDDGLKMSSSIPVVVQPLPASHHQGTTVDVKDLFCFMLNRVRFLKSEQIEVSACAELLHGFAIAHHDVAIHMLHNDRTVFEVKNAHDENALQERVYNVLGEEFAKNSIYFDSRAENETSQENKTRLYGYLSVPTHNRSKTSKIFTFVNKRLVKDNFLNKLIRAAYFNTLPQGYHPAVVLFLDVPVKSVDVNIHPSKAEVKFSDETLIRGMIIQTIRNAIGKAKTSTIVSDAIVRDIQNSNRDEIQNTQNLDSTASPNKNFEQPDLNFAHSREKNVFFNVEDVSNKQSSTTDPMEFEKDFIKEQWKNVEVSISSKLITNNELGKALFQLGLKYIIAVNDKGLVVVDQHAVHERIVLQQKYYEERQYSHEGKDALYENSMPEIPKQNLLVPITFDFGRANNDFAVGE